MVRCVLLAFLIVMQSAVAKDLQIPDTNLWFTAPEGFTELTREEIDVKFRSNAAPRYVIGNERRTTTVAYDVRSVAVTDEILEAQLDQIGESFGRVIPGFVSIRRTMQVLNGRKWAYFEMKSNAVDADIHNIVLMSAYEGRMVVLNFNSTKADFERMESILRTSIASLGSREE